MNLFKVAQRLNQKLAQEYPSYEDLTDPKGKFETIPAPPPEGTMEELGEFEEEPDPTELEEKDNYRLALNEQQMQLLLSALSEVEKSVMDNYQRGVLDPDRAQELNKNIDELFTLIQSKLS